MSRIINFTSTTRNGVYSIGEQVDFQVTFDFPVATGTAFNSTPILILTIGPIDRIGFVIAPYSSGSGTPTIVFTYTIQAVDYQLHHRGDLLDFDEPVYQPLRIQHTFTRDGNGGSYLRRQAALPLINVMSTYFPPNAAYGISRNISMVGVAPKVIAKWVGLNPTGDEYAYAPGDTMRVYVQVLSFDPDGYHSSDTTCSKLTYSINTNTHYTNTSSHHKHHPLSTQYSSNVFVQLTKQYLGLAIAPDPYILLDTGSDTPGKAWYSGRILTLFLPPPPPLPPSPPPPPPPPPLPPLSFLPGHPSSSTPLIRSMLTC